MPSRCTVHYCLVAIAALASGACVDLVKPEAVAECAAFGSCSNGISRDANAVGWRDASRPEPTPAAGDAGATAIPSDGGVADLAAALPDLQTADLAGAGVEVGQPGDLATPADVVPEGPLVPGPDAAVPDTAGETAMPVLVPEHAPEAVPDEKPPLDTWYVLTLVVGGTVASTTLQGTLTDAAGGNAKTIGPCTISGGLAAGWAGVGIRGSNTQGEFDEVQISDITP
jgi:hypothetical protein